jgi:hypothetical protein
MAPLWPTASLPSDRRRPVSQLDVARRWRAAPGAGGGCGEHLPSRLDAAISDCGYEPGHEQR